MDILPQDLKELIAQHGEALEKYYDEQLMAAVKQRNRSHLLIQIAEHLDFEEIERACAAYHHQSGPGARPKHTVPRLVRALLMGWLYGLSLRKLEEQLNVNLLFRQFAGYGIFERTPDHSTLGRFEGWMLLERRRVYFDAVLAQIYAQYPEQREQKQIGDTYGMEANAARQGRVDIWRQFGKRILEYIEEAGLESALQGWQRETLFGAEGEKRAWGMSEEEKNERLTQAALGAQALAKRVRAALEQEPSGKHTRLRETLGYLEKSLADEVVIEGETVTPRQPKGEYAICSATDPEATLRNHGKKGDKKDEIYGYNVQVAATIEGVITEIQAHTGSAPDQRDIASLVSEQKEHHDTCPSTLIYDAAAGSGKVRHDVAEASDGATQVSAPLPGHEKRTDRFGPYDFTLSEDGTTLTCPNGQTSTIAYRTPSGHGRTFRFFARKCWHGKPPARRKQADLSQRCPLWEQCRAARQGPRSTRQVFVSDYRQEVEAAAAHNRTAEYEAERRLRPRIEQVVAALVRYNGARRARRRGLEAADWQAKMAATAYNLRWWAKRLADTQAHPSAPGVDSAC
jgi:IS5 family transposase